MRACALTLSGGRFCGVFAAGSAQKARVVLFSPAGMVVTGALNPAGIFSRRTSIGPSKPSVRLAETVIGTALPFQTAGEVGLKLTAKSGRGGRTVRR